MRSLRWTATIVAATLLLAGCGSLQQQPDASLEALARPQTSDVRWFATGDPVMGASASINRGPNGINASLSAKELTSGHAYTLWVAYFNDPAGCSPPACDHDDVPPPVGTASGNPAGFGVAYGAGAVVGGSGMVTFSGRRALNDADGLLLGDELTTPNAEVHLVVRGHGPMDPADMPAQIHEFNGGCPGGVGCEDLQFAIFLPPPQP